VLIGVYKVELLFSVLLKAVVFNKDDEVKVEICKTDGKVVEILLNCVSCPLSLVVIVLLYVLSGVYKFKLLFLIELFNHLYQYYKGLSIEFTKIRIYFNFKNN
jgi:hypothetical protein